MVYSFNQSLCIYPLDAASDQAMVLCEIPAQKDSVLRFAMPADLLDLLRMFDGRRNVAEVFAAYDKLNPGKFSPSWSSWSKFSSSEKPARRSHHSGFSTGNQFEPCILRVRKSAFDSPRHRLSHSEVIWLGIRQTSVILWLAILF